MAHLSWAEVRLCEELCLGDVRNLSPALPPVITAGCGESDSPGVGAGSDSFPLILALGACPWGRGSIRAVTYSAATCLLVPGTCPRQSLEQRDASNGFRPGCSSESPGPTPEILI